MPDPIDRRAFEAMQDADPDITALGASTDQQNAEKSFNDFIGFLPSMSKFETDKLEELWIAGGKPIIKIHSEGETGLEKVNPYFRNLPVKGNEKQHVDMMGIFKPSLLEDFMAEISHAMKYALKEGESKESWIKRRERLDERVAEQLGTYGSNVYGKSNRGIKSFPTGIEYGPRYSIGISEGKEVAVDEHGNIYPEIEVPQWTEFKTEHGSGRARTTGWNRPELKYTKFDPKTRLGSEGQRLLEEFEAHEVVEDSLWGVWSDVLEKAYGE
jgi:hypothetical protein